MFTVADAVDRAQLEAAIPRAIAQAAKEMLEPTFGEFAGLARGRAARRRGRRLARGGRGLAVVRPLRLPGDRAPRHRRRRLPADVLALPRRGGAGRGAAGRRGGGALDRAGGRLQRGERERAARAALWREVDAGAQRVAEAERRLWEALSGPPSRAGSGAEPAGAAAGAELVLLGHQSGGGLLEAPVGFGPRGSRRRRGRPGRRRTRCSRSRGRRSRPGCSPPRTPAISAGGDDRAPRPRRTRRPSARRRWRRRRPRRRPGTASRSVRESTGT